MREDEKNFSLALGDQAINWYNTKTVLVILIRQIRTRLVVGPDLFGNLNGEYQLRPRSVTGGRKFARPLIFNTLFLRLTTTWHSDAAFWKCIWQN